MLGVDCEAFTKTRAPSPAILEALNQVLAEEILVAENNITENSNEAVSLLSIISRGNFGEDELKEAFCRDIDPNGFDLNKLRFDNINEYDNEGESKKKVTVSAALIITSIFTLGIFLILCILLGVKKVCYICRKSRKIYKKMWLKKRKSEMKVPESIQFSTVMERQRELETQESPALARTIPGVVFQNTENQVNESKISNTTTEKYTL